jgi:hypothetical protein
MQAGLELPHWAWNVIFLGISALQHHDLLSDDAAVHDTRVTAFACSAVWGIADYALFLREHGSKRRLRKF